MGLLTANLQQEASIITSQTDKWGNVVGTTQSIVPCRFRYISSVDRTSNAELYMGMEAMAWFEPADPIVEGTILKINDRFWRVGRLIEARRMGGTIEFIKALLASHEMIDGGNFS